MNLDEHVIPNRTRTLIERGTWEGVETPGTEKEKEG